MVIKIVDLPIKHADFPWLCKRSPEGRSFSHLAMRMVDPVGEIQP